MIKNGTIPGLLIVISLLFFSCHSPDSEEENVIAQTIVPGLSDENTAIEETTDKTIVPADSIINSIQILIDREYREYEILNINLDEDATDEQIILASPLNEDKNVFRIYIADFNEQEDAYYELFRSDISEYNLNIASIECEDLTGDHLKEIIVSGIDTKDRQIFEVFKLFPQGKAKRIFGQAADGDYEIIRHVRGNDYKIDLLQGDSFSLEVQKKNADDEKSLIVERFKWNKETELFDLSSSDKVRISSQSNENLLNFYRGTSDDYLEFLSGPWYKTRDLNGNPTHNMNEIFQLNPREMTVTFYSGDIQESFTWNENTLPVKYRHVLSLSVRNNFLTSMWFPISIYINSFESIQVKIRGNQRWGGTYTQLTENLQKALTDKSRENLLLSEMEIKGLYKTNLNTEIIFDNPEYTLKEEEKESRGIYTIFDLEGQMILQMKELSSNGLTKDIRTYSMKYNEAADDLRIIRTITLQKGELGTGGIKPESGQELHFEQIEKIDQDTMDNPQ
jgi:hypothetical protein